MIVGISGGTAPAQAQRLKGLYHFRADIQIGRLAFAAAGRADIADGGFHIGKGGVETVFYPVALHQVVVGNPDPAARQCARPAPMCGFLDDQRVEAVQLGGDCAYQAASACPYDNKIRLHHH